MIASGKNKSEKTRRNKHTHEHAALKVGDTCFDIENPSTELEVIFKKEQVIVCQPKGIKNDDTVYHEIQLLSKTDKTNGDTRFTNFKRSAQQLDDGGSAAGTTVTSISTITHSTYKKRYGENGSWYLEENVRRKYSFEVPPEVPLR